MTARIVHRPARVVAAVPPPDPYVIEEPPVVPEGDRGMRSLLMMVPMLGAAASMTVMMLFRGSSFAALGALMMIATVLGSLVMVFSQRGRAAEQRRTQRERYLEYLERCRATLGEQERAYITALSRTQPEARALVSVALDPSRLWERRRTDDDFLQVRLGIGASQTREFRTTGDRGAMQQTDMFMDAEMQMVRARYAVSPDTPLAVDLARAGHVSVVGSMAFRDQVARLLACQAATFSSPEDLDLALVTPPERREAWDWFQWFPHLADQDRATPHGLDRRIAPSPGDLSRLMRPQLDRRVHRAAANRRNLRRAADVGLPRLVVFVDTLGERPPLLEPDPELRPDELGITVVHLLSDRLDEAGDTRMRITQADDRGGFLVETYARSDAPPVTRTGRLDQLGPAEAEAIARELAGRRLSPDSLEYDAGRQALQSTELLGMRDVSNVDFERLWQPRSRAHFLSVPIGTEEDGTPVILDLKESAQSGMGPHGICVGATGSGKSEMLRMLVLGLLATHSPEDVNLVLVDFKGGATFAPFEGAPHISGIITNLSDDAALVERVYASLSGEVQRRQEVLKEAGNLPNVTAYRRLRAERRRQGGPPLEPLPHLLVIIDEFGELLTARPDFIELFLSIGRIGRSIGVHLLLSSQRIEGGKLRGLDTYLSYRLGLRTLSEAESRTILDTPDAFSLPPDPGYGYLKVDTTTYTRFRSGYVSGPVPADDEERIEAQAATPELALLDPYGAGDPDVLAPSSGAPADQDDDEEDVGPTVVDVVIEQLRRVPAVTRPVWSPPMPDVLTLDQVNGAPQTTTGGLRLRHSGWLRVPLGIVDDPRKQWQGPWELDLRRAGGHVLISGTQGSGKTTALRTIAASLAVTHAPDAVVVYGLDLLGVGLAGLTELPNVGGVGVRVDREVVRRTIEEVRHILNDRETLMQRHVAESMAVLRQKAGEPDPSADLRTAMLAEVLLFVDGFGQFGEEFDEHEDAIADILKRGSAHGIHVIATATRANEVRIRQQGYFGTKIELRLSDPGESAIGKKLSETITDDRPGRCLLESKLFAQLALPRIDGRAERDSWQAGFADLAARTSAATTVRAPGVRLLPPVVAEEMLDPAGRPGVVPIGMEESQLATVFLDTNETDRNLVAIGDPETGRTTILRRMAKVLMEQYGPDELVFAVFDPRRGLGGEIPDEYLGGYATSAMLAEQLVAAIHPELQKRVPTSTEVPDGPPPTPRIVLLVDDYDVLTAGGQGPLRPLLPFIAMSREINLSVLLTRRTSGASRGVYDPVFQSLIESGAVGFLLSGDRSEGALLGSTRAKPLPTGRAQLIRTGDAPRTVQLAFESRLDGG